MWHRRRRRDECFWTVGSGRWCMAGSFLLGPSTRTSRHEQRGGVCSGAERRHGAQTLERSPATSTARTDRHRRRLGTGRARRGTVRAVVSASAATSRVRSKSSSVSPGAHDDVGSRPGPGPRASGGSLSGTGRRCTRGAAARLVAPDGAAGAGARNRGTSAIASMVSGRRSFDAGSCSGPGGCRRHHDGPEEVGEERPALVSRGHRSDVLTEQCDLGDASAAACAPRRRSRRRPAASLPGRGHDAERAGVIAADWMVTHAAYGTSRRTGRARRTHRSARGSR